MEVRSHKYASFISSRPATPCAQCGAVLAAPEWSEYLSDCRVRHLWACSDCGYSFETLVVFPTVRADLRDDEAA